MSAYRSSTEEIKAIIRDYDSKIDMNPFIEMANVLTDRVQAKDTGSLLSSAELTVIERWLAAHFYETRDHELTTEITEKAEGKYAGEFGKGLERTRAGQNAMLFDETGYLRRISKGVVIAKAGWLGKPPSTQVKYADRD
jgi:hypothetical protein